MTEPQLDKAVGREAKKLVDEYSNMANVDKATMAIEKSEKVIDLAKKNLTKLADNMEDLDNLHNRSKKTLGHAIEF